MASAQVVETSVANNSPYNIIIIYISKALKLEKYSKAPYKILYKKISKLFKMLKQIVSQFEQMCLKLGLKK